MVDLVITGAEVVDGTGAPPMVTDVAVKDGRIVAVGDAATEAPRRSIAADGLVLAPGFVDIHTHYDAQAFWDPSCGPSLLHGVTTVVAGNCGISLAPVNPGDEDFLTRLLSRVEDIPVAALQEGVPFTWRSFAEFLQTLEGSLALNMGFLVGHSALRRAVMGEAASEGPANEDQIQAMGIMLADAIGAGGLGFSTSTAKPQVDGDGRPTPPKFAGRHEFLSLAEVVGRFRGTSLEFIPYSAIDGFTADDAALLRDMSVAARRPINWNAISVTPGAPDLHLRQLAVSDEARAIGGHVVPLVAPHNARFRMDFGPMNMGLKLVEGCEWIFQEPSQVASLLSDPATRANIRAAFERVDGGFSKTIVESIGDWVLNDATSPVLGQWLSKSVAQIAGIRGTDALDTVLDLAVEGDLAVGFVRHRYQSDAWTTERRRELLHDDRVVLGASDAGAHVSSISNAEYPTAAVRELVRESDIFRIEELVHRLCARPAALYGLTRRGIIAPGYEADLVLFDPTTVGPAPLRFSNDFPGEASHLVSDAIGVDRVLVCGVEVVVDGRLTGVLPGQVLRSGHDSTTK